MHTTEKEMYGAKKSNEEESNECKLSTVPELPELTDAFSRSNQDLNEYRNGSFTNSVSVSFLFPLSFIPFSTFYFGLEIKTWTFYRKRTNTIDRRIEET